MKLYDDLQELYNKVSRDLTLLSDGNVKEIEKEKMVAWIRGELLEIKIYLQALVENKLYESVLG